MMSLRQLTYPQILEISTTRGNSSMELLYDLNENKT